MEQNDETRASILNYMKSKIREIKDWPKTGKSDSIHIVYVVKLFRFERSYLSGRLSTI
jgi:hypothetical protein